MTNHGPDSDPAVVLTDQLSGGLSLLWADPSQGSCTTGQPVVCELGPVDAGETAVVTVRAVADIAGVGLNTADVSGTGSDPSADSTASAGVTVVNHLADIAITNTASAATVSVGDAIAYTLQIVNHGPFWDAAVTVRDWLPSRLTAVSVTTSRGTCVLAQHISCDLGRLDPGTGATVTVVARANAIGSVANTAGVYGNAYGVDDPDEDDNESRATVTIAGPAPAPAAAVAPKPRPVLLAPAPFPPLVASRAPAQKPLPVATRVALRHRGRRVSGRVASIDECLAKRTVVLRRAGRDPQLRARQDTRRRVVCDHHASLAARQALRGDQGQDRGRLSPPGRTQSAELSARRAAPGPAGRRRPAGDRATRRTPGLVSGPTAGYPSATRPTSPAGQYDGGARPPHRTPTEGESG